MGRRPQRRLRKAPRRPEFHEYFFGLHQAAGRHGDADGGLLLLGLAAYPLLPVASLPNVNYPTIQVTAHLPGADPQTMASSVATPLEEQFGQIPGITQMTSASALGYTQISLQFNLSRSVDSAATDTLSAINAASGTLPPR